MEGNGSNDITRREFETLNNLVKNINNKATATDLTVVRIETKFDDFLAQHYLCQKSTKDKFKGIYIAITTLALGIVGAAITVLIFGK